MSALNQENREGDPARSFYEIKHENQPENADHEGVPAHDRSTRVNNKTMDRVGEPAHSPCSISNHEGPGGSTHSPQTTTQAHLGP